MVQSEGERRQKGTGRVTEIPCRWCESQITIDCASVEWLEERPYQTCPTCEALVPLRYADGFPPFNE